MTVLRNQAAISAAEAVADTTNVQGGMALNAVFAGRGPEAFATMADAYFRNTCDVREPAPGATVRD